MAVEYSVNFFGNRHLYLVAHTQGYCGSGRCDPFCDHTHLRQDLWQFLALA
jgi:hypothetical protein